MDKGEAIKQFWSAVHILPQELWQAVHSLSDDEKCVCEEIRVRSGKQLIARCGERSIAIESAAVTGEDIDEILARATGSSVHSYTSQIQNGFISLPQGHRLGICGAVTGNGGIRSLTSCNLRIAREVKGIGGGVIAAAYKPLFENTLIVAPPGYGKTTLLRDMIRLLSNSYTVCIADGRYEISASRGGLCGFDIGDSDVLAGGEKGDVIEMLLRSMSPQIIALDEVTATKDVGAISAAAYTGCSFLATAHGGTIFELCSRSVYRELMGQDIFTCLVFIEKENAKRKYRIYKSEGRESYDKGDWGTDDNAVMLGNRIFYELCT